MVAPGLRGFLMGQQQNMAEDAANMQKVNGVLGLQGALMQQAALGEQIAQRQRQQTYFQQVADNLPPEQRGMFLAAPDKFLDQSLQAQFRAPTTAQDSMGRLRYTSGPQLGQVVAGFDQGKPAETAPDASGILRYKTGDQVGQAVPGFDTPKAPEGFKWENGTLKVDPNWLQVQQSIRAAGKSTVTTNVLPPQKTFENEDKLRADYTANPLVKNAAEMQNAFNLIEAAYKRPSPANDMAMATKYMKILDPTSVVRESELGLALSAKGLLDKVYNYANMISTGQKLTPAQREDFYKSATEINGAFQSARSQVDDQFKQLAGRYGLSPDNVVIGSPPSKPAEQKGKTFADFGYATQQAAIADAKDKMMRGAPKAEVIRRLEAMGVTNHGIK